MPRSKNNILQRSSITNVINVEQDNELSLNEFIVPSQNFFNNSAKSLFDNNRFYLDINAESSDEME